MLRLPELFKLLQGSYSGAFIVLWSICVVLTGISLSTQKKSWSSHFAGVAYWLLALMMIGFAACRPIGIARDDLNYLEIFNNVCPTLICSQWVQGVRDWGWYSFVGLIKSFVADPKVMLWIGAAGLLIKFAVIYRLAKQPLFALILFCGLFYEVLDLTALRIALASTVFMVGLWLLIEGRTVLGGIVASICGLFHKQAFVAAFVLLGSMLRLRYSLFFALAIFPILMLLIGWYPDLPVLAKRLGTNTANSFLFQHGLDGYIGRNYTGWRAVPIVYYPLVILAIWLARDVFLENNRLYAYASMSVVLAAWFLWGFASLPDVQVRFFDFMILPVVFLAGACRFDWWRFAGVVAVSGIFVVKYNILHPLLTGAFVL